MKRKFETALMIKEDITTDYQEIFILILKEHYLYVQYIFQYMSKHRGITFSSLRMLSQLTALEPKQTNK